MSEQPALYLLMPWPLDVVEVPVVCGATREPLGAIRFRPCSEDADHPTGVHVFEAIGPLEDRCGD